MSGSIIVSGLPLALAVILFFAFYDSYNFNGIFEVIAFFSLINFSSSLYIHFIVDNKMAKVTNDTFLQKIPSLLLALTFQFLHMFSKIIYQPLITSNYENLLIGYGVGCFIGSNFYLFRYIFGNDSLTCKSFKNPKFIAAFTIIMALIVSCLYVTCVFFISDGYYNVYLGVLGVMIYHLVLAVVYLSLLTKGKLPSIHIHHYVWSYWAMMFLTFFYIEKNLGLTIYNFTVCGFLNGVFMDGFITFVNKDYHFTLWDSIPKVVILDNSIQP